MDTREAFLKGIRKVLFLAFFWTGGLLGAVSDSVSIQEAIDAVSRAGGGVVKIPAGVYEMNETLKIPSNIILRGEGMEITILQVPQGVNFDLLVLDNVENIQISDMTLIEKDYAFRATGNGIDIRGNSKKIEILRVAVYGFAQGMAVGRDEKGMASDLTFRDCHTEGARGMGYQLNYCRQALLDNCKAFRHRLDGIKLRRHASNIVIQGGESSDNGLTGPNGNGVDAYAGGSSFIIKDLIVQRNNGSGLYIKTGPLLYQDFGEVGKVMIAGVICRENTGSGLDINRSGGDLMKEGEETLPPLAAGFIVTGGIFEKNTRSGIYIRGRNVTLLSPICRLNEHAGISISSGWDILVLQPIVTGNGLKSPGRFPAISLGGTHGGNRVRFVGGVIDGIDDPMLIHGDDISKQSFSHLRGFGISKNSSDITFRDPVVRNAVRNNP